VERPNSTPVEELLDLVQALDALGEGVDLALEEHIEAHVEIGKEVAAGDLVLEDHG